MSSSSSKWTKVTSKPHHKKKKHHHKGLGKLNKIGKGAVKRADSVGKFTGKIWKSQSDAITGLIGGLSNPIVLVAIAGVGLFILMKK